MNVGIDFLNLAGIRTTAVRETEDRIEVEAETTSPTFNAICCLAPELAPDGARANRRIINDTPQGGKAVAILLKVRRAKCKACGKKGMIETLPGLHPVRHMTARLHEHIAQQCLLRTNTRLGFEVGVTEGTARAVLKEYIDQKLQDRQIETPRVIGMDEKTLLGELRTIVCNMEERTVMEMLPDRDHSIRRYFDALPNKDRVEVVVADMYAGFHAVKKRYFPNALHVYDRFHVVRRANNVMDTIRAAVFKAADPADRKILARSKRLFMARADTLSDAGRARIARWSLQFPVLGQAYWAKERYFEMYEVCHSPDEAEWYYKNWQKTLPIDVRKIFMDKCRIHPGPQADAVFAYFTAPYTTGYIEGVNRKLDDIQRAGRGYSYEIIRGKLLLSPKLQKKTFRERLVAPVPSVSQKVGKVEMDFGQDFELFGLKDIISEPLELRDPLYRLYVETLADMRQTTIEQILRGNS